MYGVWHQHHLLGRVCWVLGWVVQIIFFGKWTGYRVPRSIKRSIISLGVDVVPEEPAQSDMISETFRCYEWEGGQFILFIVLLIRSSSTDFRTYFLDHYAKVFWTATKFQNNNKRWSPGLRGNWVVTVWRHRPRTTMTPCTQDVNLPRGTSNKITQRFT